MALDATNDSLWARRMAQYFCAQLKAMYPTGPGVLPDVDLRNQDIAERIAWRLIELGRADEAGIGRAPLNVSR